ncbi:SUMO-activating enzyme subunit 1 [Gaertneriomyces sp. JEL0708]|nr:SUMO-activating enzyme subunit 1 [Gaertneriomyces sp. JEL0708]
MSWRIFDKDGYFFQLYRELIKAMSKRSFEDDNGGTPSNDHPAKHKKIKAGGAENTTGTPVRSKGEDLNGRRITKEEADLYDRQIRLWGMEAQQRLPLDDIKRMRNANILIAGVTGISNEICKNLVLAGVGAMTVMDAGTVTEKDLGSQFFLRKEDIGQNRAEASAPRIQALNPRVALRSLAKDVRECDPAFFDDYDIVCLCDYDLTTLMKVDDICRLKGVKFYAAGSCGFLGYIFCDLSTHNYVEEHKPKDDASKVNRVEKAVGYPSLQETLSHKWDVTDFKRLSKAKLRKFSQSADPVLFAFMLLWRFQEAQGRLPIPDNTDDLQMLQTLKTTVMKSASCDESFLSDDFVRCLLQSPGAAIQPVCAVLGGFAAQDILKVLSGKDLPIDNIFCFDARRFSGKILRNVRAIPSKGAEDGNGTQNPPIIAEIL